MGTDAVPNRALCDRIAAVLGSSISLADLAEKVCDWAEGETGRRPRVDYQTIGRYMRGEITWPGQGTRSAFRAILGAASDAELGFYINRPRRASTKPRRTVEEDDPVYRRAMLKASAASAAGSLFPTALFRPAMIPAAQVSSRPLPDQLAEALSDYHQARYAQLGARLPGMMRAASSGTDWETRAGVYNLASEYLLKHGRYELALASSREAARCAEDGQDVLLASQSMLTSAIAMRHLGMGDAAHSMLADTAAELARATGLRSAGHLSQYGLMIGACGYTAAGTGDVGAADSYLAESARVAQKFPRDVPTFLWSFGPDQQALYVASAAIMLERPEAALRAVRSVDVRRRPTPERQARYLTDYAQAHLLAGKPEQAAEAMRQVMVIAPSEIRTRPTAKRMAEAAGIMAL